MNAIREQYTELLTLARQYLLQHYEAKATKVTDLDTYMFFKRCAQQQREQNAQKQNIPPLISTPVPAASHTTTASKQELPKPTSIALKPNSTPPISSHQPNPEHKAVSSQAKVQPKKKTSQPNQTGTSKALFALEPLPPTPMIDLSDIRQIVAERFPTQKILNEIPSDAVARIKESLGETSPPEVLILSFSKEPKQQAFLMNVAKAIQLLLKLNAQVISATQWEQEAQWDQQLNSSSLRLVIANDDGMRALPKFMQHYHEESNSAKCYAGKVPLCLLSDIALYFKEPKLKLSLWKTLLREGEKKRE